MSKLQSVIDDPFLRVATELSLLCYELVTVLPEEEKYGMQARLRQRAFDVANDYAEAIGAIDPQSKLFGISLTRRNLASLRTICTLGDTLGYFEIDPKVIIKIDSFIGHVTDESERIEKIIKAKQISEAVR